GIAQHPTIGSRVVQVLTGEMGCADDDRSCGPLAFTEQSRTNAVLPWIDATEVRERDRFVRMLPLVLPERQQPLSPIQVAVGQQSPALTRTDAGHEIRQVIGRVTKRVAGLQRDNRDEQNCRWAAKPTRERRPRASCPNHEEWKNRQDVPIADIE